MDASNQNNSFNRAIYALIGIITGVGLFLIYYWLLLQTSTMTAFYYNTRIDVLYVWTYVLTTIATVILFGVNVALAVYLFRRTKRLTMKDQSGTVLGGTVGAFAAACPVCGAFLLSLIGVSGGLASLPFNGLELKVASLLLIIISLWLIARRIRNPQCKDGTCPAPEVAYYTTKDWPLFISLTFLLVTLVWIGWGMLRAEPFIANL